MPDQVPADVVAERYDRLVSLQERISLERNAECVGRVFEVLVDGASKKDPSRATARTRTNKIVHLAGESLTSGRFVPARVVGAHPHHLDGVVA
jgi:tRNA-2-methylthio-N6-dimethylallyladenosine synthase